MLVVLRDGLSPEFLRQPLHGKDREAWLCQHRGDRGCLFKRASVHRKGACLGAPGRSEEERLGQQLGEAAPFHGLYGSVHVSPQINLRTFERDWWVM